MNIVTCRKTNRLELNMSSHFLLVDKIISTNSFPLGELFERKGRIYTFLNPVSYLEAVKHLQLFEDFDGIFADGSILVAAIQCLYGKTVTRRSFDMTSLAPVLFDYAEKEGKSIYIVASKQEEVDKAVKIFTTRWPKLRILGYRNGYFSSEREVEDEIRTIKEQKPDFVIVGMGVLMQETFLLKVKCAGVECIGFTCGGFIHQTAHDEIDYYPKWIDNLNLRFLYRIYKEKHTRKRYLQAALVFPVCIIYERFWKRRS